MCMLLFFLMFSKRWWDEDPFWRLYQFSNVPHSPQFTLIDNLLPGDVRGLWVNGCWFVFQIHPLLTVYWKSSWKDGKRCKIAITLKPDILTSGLELVLRLVAQLCLTLCHPIDYSPPASSVHGGFQARILEWVAFPSSRGSFQPRDWICVSCIVRWVLYYWVTREEETKTRVQMKRTQLNLNNKVRFLKGSEHWTESWRKSN